MADVITRFKLETTQYDSKLRDESNRLAEFTRMTSLAGKEFDRFTASQVEAVRELGKIAPAASSAKEQVKELVTAYNTLAKTYNVLTKEQQESDYGKAMAESLKNLQDRIAETKESMTSTGGVLDKLKERFTVNIDALKLFNIGLKAAKGALDVAKDALFSNEENLDEWGRIVQSSESLYHGFLNALNNGDISGYLKNIESITRAARNAYDALDTLGTFNAFNQVNVERTRTGMTESIVDYREGNATKEMVRAAGDAYKKQLKERQKLEQEAYIAEIKRLAAERNVNANDLITAFRGTYGSYQALKNMPMSGTRTIFYGGGMFGGGGSYEKAVPNSPQERIGEALRKLNDSELKNIQALGAQAERTANEIAQVDRQLVRVLNGRQGGGGSITSSVSSSRSISQNKEQTEMQANQTKINALTQEYVKLADNATQETQDRLAAIREEISLLETRNSKLKLYEEQAHGKYQGGTVQTTGLGDTTHLSGTGYMSVGSGLSNLPSQQQQPAMKTPKEMAKDLSQATQTLSSISSGINNIFSGLESIGVEVPDELKGIMNGITGVMTILTGISSLVMTITAIQTVKSIPVVGQFAANGGIVRAAGGWVGGSSYSGDNVPALLNSGEVVLNKAQQGNIASQLQDGSRQMQIVGEIEGEKIVLVANRSLKRSGRGELVTWKN